jgi:hypothetical protein
MSNLIEDEIISTRRSDKKTFYSIREPERISVVIGEYHPDIIQKTTENFADIVSSL